MNSNPEKLNLPKSTGAVEFDATPTTREQTTDNTSTGAVEFDSKMQRITDDVNRGPDVIELTPTPGPIFMVLNSESAEQVARLRAEHEKVVGLARFGGQDDGPQTRVAYHTPAGVKDVTGAYSDADPLVETETPRTDGEAPAEDTKPAETETKEAAAEDTKPAETETKEADEMQAETKVVKPEPKPKPEATNTAKTK